MLQGGLIGCGYVSKFHLAGWKRQTLGELIAVCDLDEDRAMEAGDDFAITHSFDSAELMFEDRELDCVEICTRPDSHLPLITLASKHVRGILCQKPIADSLETIDRMIDVCQQNDCRLMVHENWRFRPFYRRLAEEVHKGIVGRPVRLRINAHDFRCLRPGGLEDQPYFAQMPRFILYEMGPHLIDVARQVLGEPTSVMCSVARASEIAGEDSAHLVLHYADGRLAILDLCWASPQRRDDRLEWGLYETVVEGSDGVLRIDGKGQLQLDLPNGKKRKLPVELGDDPRLDSYAATQAHFLECLVHDRPFATGIDDNRRTMAIVFAGYESAATGRAVPLD